MRGRADLMPKKTPGKLAREKDSVLEQQSARQDMLKLSPKLRGKSGAEFLDKKITSAFKPSSTEFR